MTCHGQKRLGEMPGAERAAMVASGGGARAEGGPRPGLYVPADSLSASKHRALACTDCHTAAKSLPHAREMGPVSCNSSCHTTQSSDYMQGAHAAAVAKGNASAPTCSTCHGGHEILSKNHRLSQTHPLNSIKICADCHEQHGAEPQGKGNTGPVASYLDSVHGRAVARGGLAVAATCSDCHSAHKVLPSKDAASSVSRAKVGTTCGQCHVRSSEEYQKSVHGEELAKGSKNAPVCSDCHTAHAITRIDTPQFMRDIVAECGTCHDKPGKDSKHKTSLYQTYRRSYHGQATALGYERAASCSDCHGSHEIQRIDHPESKLNEANRAATCRECHPKASESFAKFEPHADHRNRERYPLLFAVWWYFIIMMSFAFGFFGLHCILWFARSLIDRVKHGPHPHFPVKGVAIRRFNRVDRVNHAFVIISFFGLALTGLPLLYADKAWAQVLADLFGGPRSAGVWHRIFAVILILNFVVHGVGIVRRIRKYGFFKLLFGPTTMLMRWQDAKDCLAMFRWFFMGGKKPTFDRWTYWEKFDYMAEVGGSVIIGVTGLLLWFPQFFGSFLPGWVFNVATIIHGYEALLAIVFIFTIHFFNAHLRMEKFPVDDVMFTGRLSEEEFQHERGVEYERLKASGELEELKVPPAPRWYRVFAVTMGITAMTIGTVIAVLIIMAGLGF
jgi:cytochrome b subunit of formate dehydrogenase